jgi:hypothetical protein
MQGGCVRVAVDHIAPRGQCAAIQNLDIRRYARGDKA